MKITKLEIYADSMGYSFSVTVLIGGRFETATGTAPTFAQAFDKAMESAERISNEQKS